MFTAILLHDVIAQSIAKHVVHIGIDGLRPDCMNNAPGGNPNIMGRIAAQGAYTLTKGRAIIETTSAPGWTANLCAMDSTLTGILNESWTPPWEGNVQRITPVTGDKPFPCIYQEIKRQQPTIRLIIFLRILYLWPIEVLALRPMIYFTKRNEYFFLFRYAYSNGLLTYIERKCYFIELVELQALPFTSHPSCY